jgi:hypothetical protein
MPWVLDPHSGGVKIPSALFDSLIARAAAYQAAHFSQSKSQLKLRFKNQFCYLDALEDCNMSPLGRLRYFNSESWSVAFFTYSNERYQPCSLSNGEWFGSFEKAIDVCSVYLV